MLGCYRELVELNVNRWYSPSLSVAVKARIAHDCSGLEIADQLARPLSEVDDGGRLHILAAPEADTRVAQLTILTVNWEATHLTD